MKTVSRESVAQLPIQVEATTPEELVALLYDDVLRLVRLGVRMSEGKSPLVPCVRRFVVFAASSTLSELASSLDFRWGEVACDLSDLYARMIELLGEALMGLLRRCRLQGRKKASLFVRAERNPRHDEHWR